MKAEIFRNGRMWVLSAVLIAGLAYSIAAVTLLPMRVYAFSCDCNEALTDAEQFCNGAYHNLSVEDFVCPINNEPYGAFSFVCSADPSHQKFQVSCAL